MDCKIVGAMLKKDDGLYSLPMLTVCANMPCVKNNGQHDWDQEWWLRYQLIQVPLTSFVVVLSVLYLDVLKNRYLHFAIQELIVDSEGCAKWFPWYKYHFWPCRQFMNWMTSLLMNIPFSFRMKHAIVLDEKYIIWKVNYFNEVNLIPSKRIGTGWWFPWGK